MIFFLLSAARSGRLEHAALVEAERAAEAGRAIIGRLADRTAFRVSSSESVYISPMQLTSELSARQTTPSVSSRAATASCRSSRHWRKRRPLGSWR